MILERAKEANISTTALTAAYTKLNTFMAAVLADTAKASDVDRDTYKSLIDAYNAALSNVKTALSNSFNADIDSMHSNLLVTSQAVSSAVIVAAQAAETGDKASYAAVQAREAANQAQTAGNDATRVANMASQAASGAVLAGSTASINADKAIKVANQAKTAGDDANSVASKASQAASSAILAGSTATVNADKAVEVANQAKTAGDDATNVANKASQAASSAILAGSTASINADKAVKVANQAKTAGDDANSVANNASQAASSAVIVASQATVTGNNASQAASKAILVGSTAAVNADKAVKVANEAKTAGDNATNVANNASQAASKAILAGSTATVNADKAIATASQAQTAVNSAANVADKASKDASKAIFAGSQAESSAKSALEAAQNTAKKYESLGMYKAWANTSPQNQNMNNWIWSDPAKKATSITYAKGVNTIDYTGVGDYEVFSMPVHAKVGNKVSVTFAYTQPSVVSLDGGSNGVPVSFSDHPSEHTEIGANPIYLGVNAQSSKVYTISTTATSETMYLSFNFGYLRDGIHWKFELSVQQDMTTQQPAVLSEYIGFSTKHSGNPADYTWLRNPDELEGEVQNQITIASNNAESKMVQTINSVGVGFKNPNGTTYTMYLTSDGTALLDFNKIMLNGQTNIQSSTIGTAQIANGAITNAQIGSLAVGTAQIKDAAINSAKIAKLAVGTAQIGDGAITNAKIGHLAVGTAQIADGAITNVQIGNEAVGNSQIKDASINSAKIAKLAVGTAQIGDGAITNAKIGKLAVGTAQIGSEAVGTAQIGDAAITDAKIGKLAVGTAQIKDAAITDAKIGSLAVGTAQIKDEAVNSSKIAKLAVGTAQIGDAAITDAKIGKLAVGTAQIANGAITDAKIGSLAVGTAQIKYEAVGSAQIAKLAVGTAQIGEGAITNAKIGKLAVGTAQIANGAITEAQIGNEAVGTSQIKEAAITHALIAKLAVGTAQIGDGAITNAKIGKLAVGTAQIEDVAITDAKIGNITADHLTSGTIDFNTITGKNINASNITTGKLDTNRLNVNKLSALSADLGDVTTGSLKGVNIVAKTFSTPNGSFTADENGSVVASNFTIRGVTNLVYNAALLGGSGSNIPGWGLDGAYYSDAELFDGIPAIVWNGDATGGKWVNFANSKQQPVTQTGIPYSASVKFRDYGSTSGMYYAFTLAFFDDAGARVGYSEHGYNPNGSDSGIQTFTVNNAIAPSNAKYVAVQTFVHNGKGHVAFSSPMLTQTAQATGYQPDTGNIVNAGEINGSTISASTINASTINAASTINGSTVNGATINGATINGATVHGTTLNGGNINTNANNTARFYPFTADSNGVIRSYNVTDYFANYARMYSGNLVISDRNMSTTDGNKYGGETAVIGGSSISLSAGYTIGKDTDFSKPLVAEGEPGTTQLVLSGINGITLKGDDQKIHFHGMYGDKQPKGITFTPYGNINGDEGSTTGNWYVGYNLANMTAQFGIDNLSKNTIGLYRPTFVDEIGAMGNRLSMGRLLLHAVDGNAQMYLLNDGSPAFVSPTIYNRTYSNGANMFVTSSGRVGRSTSASKYKLAIARSDDTLQADRLMTLNLASWNDKVATEKMAESLSNGETPAEPEINLKRHYGLIAEDLRDAGLDEFLITGKDGQIEGIEYDRLWTVLIPKIKQLNNRINELERKTL
nr:hypothetical protein [Lactiplantibacillus plantarum]